MTVRPHPPTILALLADDVRWQLVSALAHSDRRGRDLGVFNLTNTLPSLIMPAIALALVPDLGFRALFVLLAVLAVTSFASGLLVTTQGWALLNIGSLVPVAPLMTARRSSSHSFRLARARCRCAAVVALCSRATKAQL